MSNDVLIIGGGVIGLSTALRLADDGVSVTIVDRGEIGREASWAGAGMLPPGLPRTDSDCSVSAEHIASHDTPGKLEYRLRTLSNSLWPELSDRLRQQTGIDNGYRNCGSLEIACPGEDFQQRIEAWSAEGISVQLLSSRAELECHVPGLHSGIASAAFLPEFCQARNPRHLKAL